MLAPAGNPVRAGTMVLLRVRALVEAHKGLDTEAVRRGEWRHTRSSRWAP